MRKGVETQRQSEKFSYGLISVTDRTKKRMREKGILEEIMTKSFSKLANDVVLEVQEAPKIPNRIGLNILQCNYKIPRTMGSFNIFSQYLIAQATEK